MKTTAQSEMEVILHFKAALNERSFDIDVHPPAWVDTPHRPNHLYFFGTRYGRGRFQIERFQDGTWLVTTVQRGKLVQSSDTDLDNALAPFSKPPSLVDSVLNLLGL